jgi:DNA-binding transcriptional ArsR family regulator
MRPFIHPHRDEITLQGVLHALADPVRLTMFRTLAGLSCTPMSCVKCAPPDMPKSTLSHHFQVLREAGLVRSEKKGAEVVNMPRLDDLESRFPGLLAALMRAADGAAEAPPRS